MLRKIILILSLLLLSVLSASASAEEVILSPGELSAALAAAEDGDVLILSDGIYGEAEESFPLIIGKSVTIRPADGACPVIDAPPFQPAFRVEASGVTLEGLEIRFRRTGLYALGDALTVSGCRILLADPAWRTSSCGAWLGGIRNAVFKDCAFTDCGIAAAGPPLTERSRSLPVLTGLFEVGEEREFFNTHTIENCTVNGKPLFYAAGESSVTVPENAGQILIADCDEVLVRNADVSCSSMGMEIVYCRHVRVENSRADRCGVFGIYFAKLESGEMADCSAEETNHALDVRACTDITLLRCEAVNCDQGLFFSHVDRGLMKDCIVTGTGQGYFLAAGTDCLLDNCTAIGCENGFNIQKEGRTLVTGCTLRDCTICAARLDGSDVIFTDNLLEDNWVGIMAYGDVPYVLTGNTIRRSGSCGLYLRDIAFSRISGNTVEDSLLHSVEASGEMSGSLFSGNSIDQPVAYTNGACLRIFE